MHVCRYIQLTLLLGGFVPLDAGGYININTQAGSQTILDCRIHPVPNDVRQLKSVDWYQLEEDGPENKLYIYNWQKGQIPQINNEIKDRIDAISHTRLRINRTRLEDGGRYKCVVEFHESSITRHYYNVTVDDYPETTTSDGSQTAVHIAGIYFPLATTSHYVIVKENNSDIESQNPKENTTPWIIIIIIAAGGTFLFIVCVIISLILCKKKRKKRKNEEEKDATIPLTDTNVNVYEELPEVQESSVCETKTNTNNETLQEIQNENEQCNSTVGKQVLKHEGSTVEGKYEGQGKTICTDGSTYEGVYHQGLRHGCGTMTFKTNIPENVYESAQSSSTEKSLVIYEGEWLNNKYHGKGKLQEGNFVFEGQWEHGTFVTGKKIDFDGTVRDGKWKDYQMIEGKILLPDGTKKTGKYVDGKLHGDGTIEYKKGSKLEGHFENGIISGQGKITYPEGNTYEGTLKDKKPHGKGKLIIKKSGKDHCIYEGLFEDNNLLEGYCEYPTMSKFYEGQFDKTRHFDGWGMQSNKEEKYLGKWKEGFKNGYGMQWYKNGKIVIGEFVKGKAKKESNWICTRKPEENTQVIVIENQVYYGTVKVFTESTGEVKEVCGFGIMVDDAGIFYEGEWQNNMRHGKGTQYDAKNKTWYRNGKFRNDELFEAEVEYKDASVYKGSLKNWQRHGQGTLTDAEGKTQTGLFEENKFKGSSE